MAEGGGKGRATDAKTGTHDVFISYASPDSAVAEAVCEALERADVTCWIAPRDVTPGAFYADEIVHAIDAAKAIVLILSHNAAGSPHVLREVERATSKRHPLVSLRIDQAPLPAGLEYFLNTSQWLDASGGDTVRAIPRLVAAVHIAIQKPSAEIAETPTPGLYPARGSWSPRRMAIAAGAVVIVAIAGLAAYRSWQPEHQAVAPSALTVPAATQASVPVALAIPEKSIAVLPFVDMSEKKDQEYFADGLAEELIEQLGKTPGLKVIARTSAFSFKGKSDDIATIAAKLKVAHLLEGSVRRAGNHLRVSTQLLRADSGQPLWSETFDREFKDVFTIQDEIAAAVVSAMKVQLAGGPAAAPAHGTTNPEAYSAYLLGRQLFLQDTVPSWHQAIEAYQKAIGLDPRYADAYADLAFTEYFLADQTGDLTLRKSAEQTAQKAIDLDPGLPIAYATRGVIRRNQRYDWIGAESDFKQALALEPTNRRVLGRYAVLLTDVDRMDEAVAMHRKAIEQDPLDSSGWRNLGDALTASRDYPAAYDAFHHALAIRPTESTNFLLAKLQLVDGKTQQALATFQSIADDDFRDTGVAMAEHTLGDAKASQQALEKLIARSSNTAAYQIAEVYAWRGERDKAFEWLERAFRQQEGGLTELKIDPLLASLRSDPRYVAMLGKLKFPS